MLQKTPTVHHARQSITHWATRCATACAALCVTAIALTGCSKSPRSQTQATEKLSIVCTTGMIADAVQTIVGDSADVTTLIGPGVDPHLFQPTRDDIAAMRSADIVFANGLYLEGKMETVFASITASGRTQIVPVGDAISADRLLLPDDGTHHPDPHIWMDPSLWKHTVTAISETLQTAVTDTTQSDAIAAAGLTYWAQLGALDAEAERLSADIPQERRVLITAHDAFGYLARRYDFEVFGIQGLSTDSEASVRHISNLVDLIVTRNIKAVFVESTVSDRNIKALIAGAKERGHTVVIGGELYSDAMGPLGSGADTYIGMIRHNITTIHAGLTGGASPSHE